MWDEILIQLMIKVETALSMPTCSTKAKTTGTASGGRHTGLSCLKQWDLENQQSTQLPRVQLQWKGKLSCKGNIAAVSHLFL